MGLMDRDYMKDRQRERPFSPPTDRSSVSTIGIAIIFIAVLFGLYKAADWKLNQRANDLAAKKAAAEATETNRSTNIRPQVDQPLPPLPSYQNTPDAQPGSRTVTKCVVNGKTSYSDGKCATGAIASQIVTKANHNLMDAVRMPGVTQAAEPVSQSSVVGQGNQGSDYAAMKAECAALDEHIKYLDAMARQPQSAQTQDWMRDERKKARDRQSRIPCR